MQQLYQKIKPLLQKALQNPTRLSIKHKLDQIDQTIYKATDYHLINFRENRIYRNTFLSTIYFVGGFIFAIMIMDGRDVRSELKVRSNRVQFPAELSIPSIESNSDDFIAYTFKEILRKNSDKDQLDILTYILLARYLEHQGQYEVSYHFYNLAHLYDHQLIENNSSLKFDIGQDRKEDISLKPEDIIEKLIG